MLYVTLPQKWGKDNLAQEPVYDASEPFRLVDHDHVLGPLDRLETRGR